MVKFTKKYSQEIVEAVQFTGHNDEECVRFCPYIEDIESNPPSLVLKNGFGQRFVCRKYSWIVKDHANKSQVVSSAADEYSIYDTETIIKMFDPYGESIHYYGESIIGHQTMEHVASVRQIETPTSWSVVNGRDCEHRDVIKHRFTLRLGIVDRLRVLFGGIVNVFVDIFTMNDKVSIASSTEKVHLKSRLGDKIITRQEMQRLSFFEEASEAMSQAQAYLLNHYYGGVDPYATCDRLTMNVPMLLKRVTVVSDEALQQFHADACTCVRTFPLHNTMPGHTLIIEYDEMEEVSEEEMNSEAIDYVAKLVGDDLTKQINSTIEEFINPPVKQTKCNPEFATMGNLRWETVGGSKIVFVPDPNGKIAFAEFMNVPDVINQWHDNCDAAIDNDEVREMLHDEVMSCFDTGKTYLDVAARDPEIEKFINGFAQSDTNKNAKVFHGIDNETLSFLKLFTPVNTTAGFPNKHCESPCSHYPNCEPCGLSDGCPNPDKCLLGKHACMLCGRHDNTTPKDWGKLIDSLGEVTKKFQELIDIGDSMPTPRYDSTSALERFEQTEDYKAFADSESLGIYAPSLRSCFVANIRNAFLSGYDYGRDDQQALYLKKRQYDIKDMRPDENGCMYANVFQDGYGLVCSADMDFILRNYYNRRDEVRNYERAMNQFLDFIEERRKKGLES